jgi:hypothetical protein
MMTARKRMTAPMSDGGIFRFSVEMLSRWATEKWYGPGSQGSGIAALSTSR